MYLTMGAVASICQQRLGKDGKEVFQDGGTLVHRELLLVQVERHALVEPLLKRLLLLQVAVLPEEPLLHDVVGPAQVLDDLVDLAIVL